MSLFLSIYMSLIIVLSTLQYFIAFILIRQGCSTPYSRARSSPCCYVIQWVIVLLSRSGMQDDVRSDPGM